MIRFLMPDQMTKGRDKKLSNYICHRDMYIQYVSKYCYMQRSVGPTAVSGFLLLSKLDGIRLKLKPKQF